MRDLRNTDIGRSLVSAFFSEGWGYAQTDVLRFAIEKVKDGGLLNIHGDRQSAIIQMINNEIEARRRAGTLPELASLDGRLTD